MCAKIAFFLLFGIIAAEDYVHNPIQYHSQSQRGTYNWGYDTGLYGAHQFHQENRDEKGTVRGRYGYTDPDGKLRLTYYTSGADGYKTWIPKVNQDIGSPINEYKVSRSSKYIKSDDNSFLKAASKTSEKVFQQQHVHKHEESEKTDKGPTKVETKGKVVEETKSAVKDQTKGQLYQRKSYYSPAEYYKSNSQKQQKQDVFQEQQTQEVLQQAQQQMQHVYNKPEPITPNQYRHIYQPNYSPSGRYSRCYCI